MYSFSQLLFRNIAFGLLFLTVIVIFTIQTLSGHLAEKSLNFKQLVTATAISNTDGDSLDIDVFAKNISAAHPLTALTISTQTGENLFRYQIDSAFIPPAFIMPTAKRVTIRSSSTIVEYQLNFDQELALYAQWLVVLSLLTLLSIIYGTFSVRKKIKKLFMLFSKQVIDELSNVLEPSKNAKNNKIKGSKKSHLNILDIKELDERLTEIKGLLDSQRENSNTLEHDAYTDPLTDLYNRNKFIQVFEQEIAKENSVKHGVLMITRCSELQTINQIHGFTEGDNYVLAIAKFLVETMENTKSAQVFRLNSSDFATIIPNTVLKEAEQLAVELSSRFNEYQSNEDIDSVAYCGLVYFDKDKPLGELLAMADTGISIAQTQQINSWYSQKESDELHNNSSNYGNQNWRQEIDKVIENKKVTLLVQHIQPNTRTSKVYGEVLARFLNSNDEMLPTASFIAMAEKLDKIVEIDRLIIESVINEITQKNLFDQSFGINISSRSIHDNHFIVWLERLLLRVPNIAPRLVFELSEFGLQQNIRSSKKFIDMVHRAGARITVERFGVGLTSFKFFRDLKPDFVKMDSTYTRDIDEDKNNQYFLRLMVDLAHRLSISVLAESVESQEEKHALEKLFLDGCQGFYIGKPTPI